MAEEEGKKRTSKVSWYVWIDPVQYAGYWSPPHTCPYAIITRTQF
jgi:hypothetical protein